jgi:predicted TIM-barrel fold metal-dependent hydrolase
MVEPGDVWTARMPKEFKDRAPRYDRRGDVLMTVVDGIDTIPLPIQAFARADGSTLPPDDVPSRLALLDKDGIWAEALIGNLADPVVFGIEDPDFALACARAYNDWVAETFLSYGERQVGIAFVPVVGDIAKCVEEIERVAELGLRGFTLPLWPPEPYFLSKFEPMWRAAASLGLAISFHAHTGTFFKKVFLEPDNPENYMKNDTTNVLDRAALKTAGGFGGTLVQSF